MNKETPEAILKSIYELSGDESVEFLRKGVIASKENPLESVVFFLKALSHVQEGEAADHLRKGIVSLESNPIEALSFFLKATSIGSHPESSENLHKALVSLEEDPMESLHFLLKLLFQKNKSLAFDDLRKTLQSFPDLNWRDAFSYGQIASKKWLVEQFAQLNLPQKNLGYIHGGWYGVLPWVADMMEVRLATHLRSFDIDDSCYKVAESLNKKAVVDGWSFKAVTKDINEIQYNPHTYNLSRSDGSQVEVTEIPGFVINTSCEHLSPEWYSQVPAGTLLALQSNNFLTGEGHVNCVESLADFKAQFSMSDVMYEGTLKLPSYERFMIIGCK